MSSEVAPQGFFEENGMGRVSVVSFMSADAAPAAFKRERCDTIMSSAMTPPPLQSGSTKTSVSQALGSIEKVGSSLSILSFIETSESCGREQARVSEPVWI